MVSSDDEDNTTLQALAHADNGPTLASAQRRNAAALPKEAQDKTYRNEWRKFTAWVEANAEEQHLDRPSPFVTRLNVDSYFLNVVTARQGMLNTNYQQFKPNQHPLHYERQQEV